MRTTTPRTAIAVAVVVLSIVASASDVHGSSGDRPSLAALRRTALATLRRHCTPCHDTASSAAVPGATAVFDVASPAWHEMSGDELRSAIRRVEGKATPSAAASFRAFVRAELDERAS